MHPVNRIPGRLFVRNLIERRGLLFELVQRDFRQRFVGSAAGWIWGIVHPLVLLLSWTFVFQWVLKTELPAGEVTQNYTLYLFCGFLPWLLFQETVQRSATSLLENANLITKTVFPSEVVPIAVFLSSLVHHCIAVVLVLIAIAGWEHRVSAGVLLLPLYIGFIGLLGVGLGWVVASLQVYLRDTAQVLSVVMTFWFWTTPIFISEQKFPERLHWILHLNPLAYVVRAYRDRLLSSRPPAWEDVLILAAYGTAFFVVGGLFFRHLKRGFADVL